MTTDLPPNLYATDLGDRDPLDALADTPQRIRNLVESWTDEQLERRYAPGKWTARQVLIHLAQTELAQSTRLRFAIAREGYTAQPFSPDDWLPSDSGAPASLALDVYTSLRRMNVGLLERLPPDLRARRFAHPEFGSLSVWWIAAQLAGHDIHHLKQLTTIT